MLRPDQAQRDRTGQMSQEQHSALAYQAIRYKYTTKPGDSGPAYFHGGWGIAVMEAIVTTAITPASSTDWGTGKVQLYYYDDSVSTTQAQPDTNGDDGAGNSAVKNWYTTSGTVAVGKHCQVYMAAGGLRLLTWEC